MRVFMLGWEFPPFIAGGLGTACYGLTKALSRQGVRVTFVLPKGVGTDYTSHVRFLSSESVATVDKGRPQTGMGGAYELDGPGVAGEFENVTFKGVPSRHMHSSYQSVGGELHGGTVSEGDRLTSRPISMRAQGGLSQSESSYGGDIFEESRRYAEVCVGLGEVEDIDVIHAHDWMTFPAGLAVSRATGRPLVVHVHSTEYDRAGEQANQEVCDVERRGMQGAMRVIAVSHLTKSIIVHRYGIEAEKIDVVHNGIENDKRDGVQPAHVAIAKTDKIVLFLGRITMQKGPEYFMEAAKKVLDKFDKVKFVVAGTGDKTKAMMDIAAAHGISHKVLFTGFLRGSDVERVFKMADVYVMPSVSEPFGIAPLEAISHDVPVIISKTSGVSEVLAHALKVDFWDVSDIANKILAVLKHPPLSSTLREHADLEIRKLTWDGAASRCRQVYEAAVGAMS